MNFTKKNLIVLYHRPESIAWFEKSIRTIGKFFRFVTSDDIVNYYDGKISLENCCHITFDDGHKSIYDHAYPILKKYGLNASLFVSSSIIKDNDNYWWQKIDDFNKDMIFNEIASVTNSDVNDLYSLNISYKEVAKQLSLEQIRQIIKSLDKKNHFEQPRLNINKKELIELSESGAFTIGSHTVNHPILSNESNKVAEYEISKSLDYLSNLLNRNVNTLAYPNGIPGLDFTQREVDICNNNGVKAAYSCEVSYFSENDSKLSIPRLEISAGGNLKIGLKLIFLNLFKSKLSNEKVTKNRRKMHKMINPIKIG
tara:strand:- start:33 stop:968 length:936 start_codon:yes stop_codon:yes gene_type:complete